MEYFERKYFEVLDLLNNELKRRFQQERGMPVAQTIEKLLIDHANGTQTDESLPKELDIYKSDLDFVKLKFQLKMLPDLVKTQNQQEANSIMIPITRVTNVRTVAEILNQVSISKTMLSEVSRLIRIFLTIPVSTCTAERTFSSLKRLKTFLRSTMTQPRLNNLMVLYVHREKTEELNVRNIAKDFKYK